MNYFIVLSRLELFVKLTYVENSGLGGRQYHWKYHTVIIVVSHRYGNIDILWYGKNFKGAVWRCEMCFESLDNIILSNARN